MLAEIPLNSGELTPAVDAILDIGPDRCGREQAFEAYRQALELAWLRMERVVGAMGAGAVVERGVRLASARCPELSQVKVGERGVDLSRLEAGLSESDPEMLCRCLRELYVATLHTLMELTGDVVIGPLLEEMREHYGRRTDG